MTFQENQVYLKTSDLKISYKTSPHGSIPLIAVHGWLDNANSFDFLAPHLDKKIKLYALDLPGHGLSDHNKKGADYLFSLGVQQLIELTEILGLESFHLLGHSLGAALTSLVAGVIPKKIKTLTLIEGLGPITYPKEDLPQKILHNLKMKKHRITAQKPLYKSEEEGALDRHKKTDLSYESALSLAQRGLGKINDKQYTWLSDPKLLIPPLHPFTEDQVSEFLKKITSPTLVVLGKNGLKFVHEAMEKRLKLLTQKKVLSYPGGHHVHMEQPIKIAQAINSHLIKKTFKSPLSTL